MPDLRKISGLAIILIVAVRLCIGWQFVYEGLWKLDSQKTTKPWTAAGYLKNARGPFRQHYRDMTGDPDDLSWLDYKQVAQRWDDWYNRFQRHHPDLTKDQKNRLNQLLNGAPQYRAELNQLPDKVKFGGSIAKVARFDPKQKRLIVNGSSHPKPAERHLLPAERDAMLKMARIKTGADLTPEEQAQNKIVDAYHEAVRTVYKRSARLGIKEQALALLKGDPERATQIYAEQKGTIDYKRMGNIDLYKVLLAKYEKNLAAAKTDFQYDHLKKQWGEIQGMRADLVGPIKALDSELKDEARELLTPEQLARGPVPAPIVGMARIDLLTMWALLVIGILLMAGFFSRVAAVAGAGLLFSFYLAMPPWPSVPGFQELPGPEHSFIIDKNLIEVVALLAIAAMPTGSWFGIDAIFYRLFGRGRKVAATPATPTQTTSKPAESKDTYKVAASEKQPTS